MALIQFRPRFNAGGWTQVGDGMTPVDGGAGAEQLAQGVAGEVFAWRRHRVQAKAQWTDAWADVDYLECAGFTESAAPAMPYARLRWRVGSVRPEDAAPDADDDGFETRTPLDLKEHYVRVVLLAETPPAAEGGAEPPGEDLPEVVAFEGYVPEHELEIGGTNPLTGVAWAEQTIVAVGLEFPLDYATILNAYVTNDNATVQRVYIPLPFNEHYVTGVTQVGNRSSVRASQTIGGYTSSAYIYGPGGNVWTAYDILEYLLAFHGPGSTGIPGAGATAPAYRLGGQAEALRNIIYPAVDWAGRTVYQVLNALIDRRRGLGWYVRTPTDPNDTNPVREIHVFSLVDEDIAVGSTYVPANPEKVELTLTADIRLDAPVISSDTLTRYGAVAVIGEPIVVCFSASIGNGRLFAAWSGGQESSYLAGSGDGSDPDANDALRGEESLRNVFSRFLLPANWYQVGANLNPGMTADGYLNFGEVGGIRQWGRQLLNHLPFISGSATLGLGGGDAEFTRPMAFLFDPELERWVQAEAAGVQLAILEREMGVQLQAPYAHLLALNHWDGAAESTAGEPAYDYASLVVTVAARVDRAITVERVIPTGDPNRVLTIRVPGAELHWLAAGTATGVSGGSLTASAGQVLRDDTAKLRQIAALAAAWYGKTRSTLRVATRQVMFSHRVGTFVTAVTDLGAGGQPVNSPVTEKYFDLDQNVTVLQTSYVELDAAAMVPRRGQ